MPPTDPAAAQPALFDDDALDASAYHREELPAKVAGRFTAARFLRDHPDKYRMAVDMTAAGLSRIQIARILQVSVHTLMEVEAANPVSIAQARDKHIQRLQAGADLALDSIIEVLADPVTRAKIPGGTLGVMYGILKDHLNKATGQPTEIVGHVLAGAGHGDARAYSERMRQAQAAKAGAPPYAPGMVMGPQTSDPKRREPEGLALTMDAHYTDVPLTLPDTVVSDSQSDSLQPIQATKGTCETIEGQDASGKAQREPDP
jgi:hypothetical protein